MSVYRCAVRTPAAAAAAAFCDLRTAATDKAFLLELKVFSTAATAASIGLVRAATVGTASTTTAGQPNDPGDPAATVLVGTAWSAAPTVGAIFLERFEFPATLGSGIVYNFEHSRDRGIAIPVSSSLLLWNFGAAAGPVLDVTFVWGE